MSSARDVVTRTAVGYSTDNTSNKLFPLPIMVHRTLPVSRESLRGMELLGPQASGSSPWPGVEESRAPADCSEVILAVVVAVFFVSYGEVSRR